jgi:hypothetical protein
MARPETGDRQAPLNPGTVREVGLATITMGQAAGMEYGQCSCGWGAYHKRLKVLDDRIDKHIRKSHNGRGIRL